MDYVEISLDAFVSIEEITNLTDLLEKDGGVELEGSPNKSFNRSICVFPTGNFRISNYTPNDSCGKSYDKVCREFALDLAYLTNKFDHGRFLQLLDDKVDPIEKMKDGLKEIVKEFGETFEPLVKSQPYPYPQKSIG